MCLDDQEFYIYAGISVSYSVSGTLQTAGAAVQLLASSGYANWFTRDLTMNTI